MQSCDASCDFSTLNVEGLEIVNTGGLDVNDAIDIDFFYDADDNGNYSTGDILIGNTTSASVAGLSIILPLLVFIHTEALASRSTLHSKFQKQKYM